MLRLKRCHQEATPENKMTSTRTWFGAVDKHVAFDQSLSSRTCVNALVNNVGVVVVVYVCE